MTGAERRFRSSERRRPWWRRLPPFGDERAVAAVEFAILLPLLVTLFIASNEIAQALTIHRKVSHTASTLGDLVAQSPTTTVTTSTMSDYFTAAKYILLPYDIANAKLLVAGVYYTTASGYKTCWSAVQNATAWTEKATPPITLPTGLVSNGQQLIVAQTTYTYTSLFSTFMHDIWGSSTITISDLAYLRPRNVTVLLYAGASSTTCP